MKIQLRELSIYDLTVGYARLMGGNKIRHYKVGMTAMMLNPTKSTKDVVSEYILREEPDAEIEFVPSAIPAKIRMASSLQVEDASFILKDHPEIKKALLKYNPKSQILQKVNLKKTTLLQKIFNVLVTPINWVIKYLNSFWIQMNGSCIYDLEYQGKLIPIINKYVDEEVSREAYPATYLSVCFEEGDEDKAAQAMLNDLKTLHEKTEILGAIALPSMIELADTTGSGKRSFVLFCFPFVKYPDLSELKNEHGILNPNPENDRKLGVMYSTREGGGNWLNNESPESKYEIEHVFVDSKSKEIQEAYVEAYEESIEEVNKVTAHTRKLIEEDLKARKQS